MFHRVDDWYKNDMIRKQTNLRGFSMDKGLLTYEGFLKRYIVGHYIAVLI